MFCYFDNAATTRPYDEVIAAVCEYQKNNYANPSSMHSFGMRAGEAVVFAARQILDVLKLPERRVIFTSGATESANLAIRGTLEKYRDLTKQQIITTSFEHPCVSEIFSYYKTKGACVEYISVSHLGQLSKEELENLVSRNTRLVSLIWVHNELGSIQDISNLIQIIKAKNPSALVHIDAVQGFGKVAADLAYADMITISAHKFHGPKGIGALILKKDITLVPQLLGGGQQSGLRSGTIAAPLVCGLGRACEILRTRNAVPYLKNLQRYLYQRISDVFGEEVINTKLGKAEYAPHILSLSFEGLKSEVLVHMLEEDEIFIANASACSAHKKDKQVLSAIGLAPKRLDGTLRISLSEYNTKEQIDFLIEKLAAATKRLKGFKS